MTYLTKNLAFFSNLDGMQAICAEKMSAKKARPLRRSRARFPLLSPAVTSSPGAGEVFPQRGSQAVKLIAKVFCVMGKFLTQAQSLRARQRLPPRGSWQNRQVLTEGVQAVTPSASLRSQPAPPRGRLCVATAEFPATTKAVPLRADFPRPGEDVAQRQKGECGIAAGDDGRGSANKKLSRRAAASAGSRRGSCRLPLRPLL